MDAPKPLTAHSDALSAKPVDSFVANIVAALSDPLDRIGNHAQTCLTGASVAQMRAADVESLEKIRLLARWARRQLRNLSHQHGVERETTADVSLSGLVEEVVTKMEPELRAAGMAVRLESAREMPMVPGDPSHLRHAMANLIENAIDAMSAPGVAAKEILISTRFVAGLVTIEVCDRGVAPFPSPHEEAFGAFKTTKKQGMGLGLTVAREIVKAHGGTLIPSPRSGGGTVLRVSIPITKSGPSGSARGVRDNLI